MSSDATESCYNMYQNPIVVLRKILTSTPLTSLTISSYYTAGVPSFNLNSPPSSTIAYLVRSAMTQASSTWCPAPLPTIKFYFTEGITGS